jgi:ferritin-like metal-binding protein YciE
LITLPLLDPRDPFAARLRQMLWVELCLSEHVSTLRAILDELAIAAEPEVSPLTGLVADHDQLLRQIPEGYSVLRDLAHAQAAAMTEHLEMAAYQ